MINVKDFGASGNGTTDDSSAISKAIQAANTNGPETVFFPPGTYFLERPVVLNGIRYLTLLGKEAVILCQGNEGAANTLGAGGGIAIKGDHVTVYNLQFHGHIVENFVSDFGNGKLLRLYGSYNEVLNCYFRGGNAGAIEIVHGQYNTVRNNVLEKCNNYPPAPYTGDYGAIHIVGRCRNNTISHNKIIKQRYSGISGYGTGVKGEFSDLYIHHNYIESLTADRSIDHSMGIYLLNGANHNVEIKDNTINKADAECIVIFSSKGAPAEACTISNNVLLDGAYQGLAFRSQDQEGGFHTCSIDNNYIGNSEKAPDYDHQIFLENFQYSTIENNTLQGYSAQHGQGIYFYQQPYKVSVKGNNVSQHQLGIAFYSEGGLLESNFVSDCGLGIRFAYCQDAKITNNVVTDCKQPVEYKLEKKNLQLSGNIF